MTARARRRPGHVRHQGAGGLAAERGVLGSARGRRATRRTATAGWSSRTRRAARLGRRGRARRRSAAAGRPGRRGRPGQPGRDGARVGPRHRAAARPAAVGWQDRRSARSAPAGAERDRAGRRSPASRSTRTSPRRRWRWLRENVTRDGVVTTTDAWLVHALTGAFVTDASTASRTMLLDLDACAWSTEALEVFGLDGERLPSVVDVAGVVGTTAAFGRRAAADRAAGRPAGGAARRGLPGAGRRRSARTAPGRSCWPTSATVARRSTTGLTASVAWRLARDADVLPGRAGATRSASAVRWLVDLGVLDGGRRPRRGRRRGRRTPAGVTFVPALGRARCAVVARRRPRQPARARPATRAAVTWSARSSTGIAAQVVELVAAVAADIGRPLDRAARRRRPDPVARCSCRRRPTCCRCRSRSSRRRDATALGVAALARLGLGPVAVARRPRPVAPASRRRVFEPRIASPTRRPSGSGDFRAAVPALDGSAIRDRAARPGDVRRRGRRCRRRRVPRSRASSRRTACGSWSSTAPTTSATGRRRPTPRSCTPGSTRRPGSLEAELVRRGHALLVGVRRRGRASRSSAPARCWWRGTTEQLAALPALAEKAAANGYAGHARDGRRRGAVPRRAAPGAGRAGRVWRCPTRASSTRGRRRSRS